jgi:hypothetical protein
MVEVHYKGRLGNQMFQYALGRIIAEHLGYSLESSPLLGLPRTADLISGDTFQQPIQTLQASQIDLPAILQDKTPRKIVLNGWFQCPEYYLSHREQLREWFHPVITSSSPPPQTDLVVHVRRTDYLRLGWALPFSFYEAAIQHLLPSGGSLTIVTDDPGDPFFHRFKRWKPSYHRDAALPTMAYLAQAPRLILSPSTYSWWPAFLGSAKIILCPVPHTGPWSDDSSEQITLARTPGFIQWPICETYSPNLAEMLYHRYRRTTFYVVSRMNHYLGTRLEHTTY